MRCDFHRDSPKPTAVSTNERLLTSKAMICVVTAEPTPAPMMTARACASVRTPAETKPIAINEVTVEDCTIEVMPMPVSKALKRLLASPAMMVFSREPAIARIAFDIVVMPCRNSASPPARPISMGASDKDS